MLDAAEQLTVWRILDANLNRAQEGLRVLEDYARFHCNASFFSTKLKTLRHRLAEHAQQLDVTALLSARDTVSDVGTHITTATETKRENLLAVVRANFQRLEQALRTLEEYGKIVQPSFAAHCEQIRYECYTLEKSLTRTHIAREQLHSAQLYVLLDGQADLDTFSKLATSLITAGVHLLQLRDKTLSDRELLARAICLRTLTQGTSALCIINDRPDIALLSNADGVHIGQDELPLSAVRKIVGSQRLIGVSTHNLAQAREATLAGADYIGCGPTFPSTTKAFSTFPGLDFLKSVAEEIPLPAFAIGGIGLENLSLIRAAGVNRIAVSGAVLHAPQPVVVVEELLRSLCT
jgi:thiamine-phosphate pyrophosphorylase